MSWLIDVLARVVFGRIKAHEPHTLLPWKWLDQIRADAPTRQWRHNPMLDHPDQVERLMERLTATLPIPARVTPETS